MKGECHGSDFSPVGHRRGADACRVHPQIGTSKAERMGKVEVSEAKRRRIKAGNIITAIGFAVCILTGLSSVKAPVIRRSPLT